MADRFETRLEAMFAEPATVEGEAAFLAEFDRRMRRGSLIRRAWLWGAGGAGAAIAAAQVLAGDLGRILALGGGVVRDLTAVFNSDGAAVVATPSLTAAAIGLSILALFVIGVRAASA